MTFHIFQDGNFIYANELNENFSHINYGSNLLPCDSTGAFVNEVIDLGSSTYKFLNLHTKNINISNQILISGDAGDDGDFLVSNGTNPVWKNDIKLKKLYETGWLNSSTTLSDPTSSDSSNSSQTAFTIDSSTFPVTTNLAKRLLLFSQFEISTSSSPIYDLSSTRKNFISSQNNYEKRLNFVLKFNTSPANDDVVANEMVVKLVSGTGYDFSGNFKVFFWEVLS